MTNKEILKSFEKLHTLNYGARFFKADLHYHTPASEDARGKNRYNFNPYNVKYPHFEDTAEYRHEMKAIHEKILADARKVAESIVKRFIEVNISLVAITDHNGIGTIWTDPESDKGLMDLAAPTWYELIDDEAKRINNQANRTIISILPGVEISTTGIHVLAIFPPQEPRRKIHFIICDLLHEAGFKIDDWGKNPKVGTISVFRIFDLIRQKGGLPLPAHIDGSDQALLRLYSLKSGAMKNVLKNPTLEAIEVVDPEKFKRYDRKLKKNLKNWIGELRHKADLSLLAYFQGSDAHDLSTIGKRYTYVKMTESSYTGLITAIKMPSSRIRISDMYIQVFEGFYIHGVEIKNSYFGTRSVRFNRHLNCITGKKGAGKSFLYKLIQACINPSHSLTDGSVKVFIERISDTASQHYVYTRERNSLKVYAIKEDGALKEVDIEQAEAFKIKPKFYNAERIEELISGRDMLDSFLRKYFGHPTKENIRRFNELFSVAHFLEETKEPLLEMKKGDEGYDLFLNINWRSGRAKMRDFFNLSLSLRRTVMMVIIVILSDFGPTIIDAPEDNFDNEDITKYLVPIIKQYKVQQQVILFTNNPILAVNTDPDNYILLETKATELKTIHSGFAIDDERRRPLLVNLFEGSLKAFYKRAAKYNI
ncbi:MAG: hypothetical protein ACMUJM_06710 [bacterium]